MMLTERDTAMPAIWSSLHWYPTLPSSLFAQNAPSWFLVSPNLLVMSTVNLSCLCKDITLTILFFLTPPLLWRNLSFPPNKETLFTTLALSTHHTSFLLQIRKHSKDTFIHLCRITSSHSLLALHSPTKWYHLPLLSLKKFSFYISFQYQRPHKMRNAWLLAWNKLAYMGKSGQIFGGNSILSASLKHLNLFHALDLLSSPQLS